MGWGPKTENHNPLQWRGRELNPAADFLANEAMDKKVSMEWQMDRLWLSSHYFNIQTFTYGGRKKNGDASSAWAIYAISSTDVKIIAYGYKYEYGIDSYQAETRAVDYALLHLRFVLNFLPTR